MGYDMVLAGDFWAVSGGGLLLGSVSQNIDVLRVGKGSVSISVFGLNKNSGIDQFFYSRRDGVKGQSQRLRCLADIYNRAGFEIIKKHSGVCPGFSQGVYQADILFVKS